MVEAPTPAGQGRAAGGMDARIAASDSETLQAMAGGYYGMEVVRGLEIEVVG